MKLISDTINGTAPWDEAITALTNGWISLKNHKCTNGGGGFRVHPHYPQKIFSIPMLQKFHSTSLFKKKKKKAPQWFSWQKSQLFFSDSGQIYYFTFIIICPLKCAKKWSLFMWKPCNIVKKANKTFWSLCLTAIFRWYKQNGKTAWSNLKKFKHHLKDCENNMGRENGAFRPVPGIFLGLIEPLIFFCNGISADIEKILKSHLCNKVW